MAEHYRLPVGEKTRDALAHLREAGRRFSGRPPFGWRFLPTGEVRVHKDGRAIPVYRLEPDPAEQAVLARIRRLRAAGLSLRAISHELVARGIFARNGRPFAARTLARLVTDRTVSHSGIVSIAIRRPLTSWHIVSEVEAADHTDARAASLFPTGRLATARAEFSGLLTRESKAAHG